MKLYEYEAKEILKKFGLKCPPAILINIDVALEEKTFFENEILLNEMLRGYVVKSQVLSGGRGKACGIKFASCMREVKDIMKEMLGKTLITLQNPEGEIVKTILIEQRLPIEKEFYLSFAIDRNIGKPVFIVSPSGGVSIEEIAEESPEKIMKIIIEPLVGICDFQIRNAADFLGLNGTQKEFLSFIKTLFRIFNEKDLLLLEINPLALTAENQFVCLDAKMIVDDYAIFRQPEFLKIKETRQSRAHNEIEKAGLNYHIICEEGVGMFSNGAGLLLDTLDRVKEIGINTRGALDLGGTITKEQICLALKVMNNDSKIKFVFGNIYTALTGTEKISDAVIQFLETEKFKKPFILRLEGRQADESIEVLKELAISNLYVFRTTEESLTCLQEISRGKKNDNSQ